jgi:hypothetical protein
MKFNSFSKIIFDIIMLILLVVVYCAQPTGKQAHEYIGLAIYIFFIVHLAYNYKWIINVGKKFFDKSVGFRIKFIYIIDFLLLLSFVLIGISGIMISHIIFKLGIMPLWRQLHTIASAVSVILLGVHIGLHGKMIINVARNKTKLPYTAIKIMALIVFVVIVFAGLYGEIKNKVQASSMPRYSTVTSLFERSITFTNASLNPAQEKEHNIYKGQVSNGQRREGGQMLQFDINRLLVSVANYMLFILLCSIIVYILDNKLRKGKNE